MDYFMIPRRIRERAGKSGLVVLIGNTKGTLQRNVIEPMIDLYGPTLVSPIKCDNSATMFGERVFCLGADSKKHVDRLRGSSIKYCYGDEIVTWDPEVFEMLKSRLDKECSCMDGTCNPKGPDHWFKKFIDSGADIFYQSYSLDDNPFLPAEVREALKREHKGVFYDRYILGLWVAAEGLIFPEFAQAPADWDFTGDLPVFSKITIGIDFGGNGSTTRLTACGFVGGFQKIIVLAETGLPAGATVDAGSISKCYIDFYKRVRKLFGRVDFVFGDCASPTMINTLIAAARAEKLPWQRIVGCRKNAVEDRPKTLSALLGAGRLAFLPECRDIKRALASLRWDARQPDRPEDKNLGNINDIYDSFCYCWLDFVEYIDRGRTIY